MVSASSTCCDWSGAIVTGAPGAVGGHVAELEVDVRLRRRGGGGLRRVESSPPPPEQLASATAGAEHRDDEHRDDGDQARRRVRRRRALDAGGGVGVHRRLRVGDRPSPTRALERRRRRLVSLVPMALKKMVERLTKPVEEIDREQLTAFCDARQLAAMDDDRSRARG